MTTPIDEFKNELRKKQFSKGKRPEWLTWIDALTEVDDSIHAMIRDRVRKKWGPPKPTVETIPTPGQIESLMVAQLDDDHQNEIDGLGQAVDKQNGPAQPEEQPAAVDDEEMMGAYIDIGGPAQPGEVDDEEMTNGDASLMDAEEDGPSSKAELIRDITNLHKRLSDAEAEAQAVNSFALKQNRQHQEDMREVTDETTSKFKSLRKRFEEECENANKLRAELSLAKAGIQTTPTLVCDPRLPIKFPDGWTATDAQVAFEHIAIYTKSLHITNTRTVAKLQSENEYLRTHLPPDTYVRHATLWSEPDGPCWSPGASPRTNKCAEFAQSVIAKYKTIEPLKSMYGLML